MVNILILFTFISFSGASFGMAKPEVIEQFDIKYYNPINFGLRDLVFEARIENLTKKLNERFHIGKMTDVYFKVFWIYPGKYHIEVFGIPDTFNEIKNEVRQLIKPHLDYIIPQKLWSKLRKYQLTSQSLESKAVRVTGKDPTFTLPVSQIILDFNKLGMLESSKSFSGPSVSQSNLEMSPKSWSRNKWVLNKLTVSNKQGVQESLSVSEFEYDVVNGLGFPSEISIETTYTVKNPKKKQSQKMNAKIVFSKYEVNTNKAKKAIVK